MVDSKCSHETFCEVGLALVLVPPYHDIHPFRNHTLMDTVLAASTVVPVLMQHEDVQKRLALLWGQSGKPNLLLVPHAIQSFVAHCAQAVQGNRRPIFLQQDGGDGDIF